MITKNIGNLINCVQNALVYFQCGTCSAETLWSKTKLLPPNAHEYDVLQGYD